jgi:hypothetical protein
VDTVGIHPLLSEFKTKYGTTAMEIARVLEFGLLLQIHNFLALLNINLADVYRRFRRRNYGFHLQTESSEYPERSRREAWFTL